MKLFITGFILLLYTLSYAQNDTIWYNSDWKETKKKEASFYRPKPEKIGNYFIIKDYYTSGQLQMEAKSLDEYKSEWDGELKHYYENGNIKDIANYKNNILHGNLTIYFENGTIYGVRGFKDGLDHGKIISFHENGNLSFSGFYKDGYKEGEWKSFFEDGKKMTAYQLVDGKLQGKIFLNNINGELVYKGIFKNGAMIKFTRKSNRLTNGSNFTMKAKTKKGIEYWEIYRDKKLIIKSQFKSFYRYGEWEMYATNGKNVYIRASYTDYPDCETISEIQETKQLVPLYSLPSRFQEPSSHDIDLSNYSYDRCINGTYEEFDIHGKVIKKIEYKNGEHVETLVLEKTNNPIDHPIFTLKED